MNLHRPSGVSRREHLAPLGDAAPRPVGEAVGVGRAARTISPARTLAPRSPWCAATTFSHATLSAP